MDRIKFNTFLPSIPFLFNRTLTVNASLATLNCKHEWKRWFMELWISYTWLLMWRLDLQIVIPSLWIVAWKERKALSFTDSCTIVVFVNQTRMIIWACSSSYMENFPFLKKDQSSHLIISLIGHWRWGLFLSKRRFRCNLFCLTFVYNWAH